MPPPRRAPGRSRGPPSRPPPSLGSRSASTGRTAAAASGPPRGCNGPSVSGEQCLFVPCLCAPELKAHKAAPRAQHPVCVVQGLLHPGRGREDRLAGSSQSCGVSQYPSPTEPSLTCTRVTLRMPNAIVYASTELSSSCSRSGAVTQGCDERQARTPSPAAPATHRQVLCVPLYKIHLRVTSCQRAMVEEGHRHESDGTLRHPRMPPPGGWAAIASSNDNARASKPRAVARSRPTASMESLMSQTRTLEEAALVPVRAAASRSASEMRNAMSPVPPATSRKRSGSSVAGACGASVLRRAPAPRPVHGGQRRTIGRWTQLGDELVLPQPVQRAAHQVVHHIVSAGRGAGQAPHPSRHAAPHALAGHLVEHLAHALGLVLLCHLLEAEVGGAGRCTVRSARPRPGRRPAPRDRAPQRAHCAPAGQPARVHVRRKVARVHFPLQHRPPAVGLPPLIWASQQRVAGLRAEPLAAGPAHPVLTPSRRGTTQ